MILMNQFSFYCRAQSKGKLLRRMHSEMPAYSDARLDAGSAPIDTEDRVVIV